ncbi:hypothetical protein [Corynebacterium sp. AOP12-C2-36]|uniref:hypothetical protein n=1 Tax=Corynebacterium sp. AOP12-C2-36 TaxID=3457723 RepID=UPI00403473DF
MGGDLVGVTAGHCIRDASTSAAQWYPDGGSQVQALGTFDSSYCVSDETCGDYGLIDIDDKYGYDGKIAGKYEISGVLAPSDLTPDMELCKYGLSTGESCGKLMMREGNRGWAAMTSYEGDSGAPVYAKNSDGTAQLVGVLSGSPHGSSGIAVDQVSDFTFATEAVKGLGLDKIYG